MNAVLNITCTETDRVQGIWTGTRNVSLGAAGPPRIRRNTTCWIERLPCQCYGCRDSY